MRNPSITHLIIGTAAAVGMSVIAISARLRSRRSSRRLY